MAVTEGLGLKSLSALYVPLFWTETRTKAGREAIESGCDEDDDHIAELDS
jgi:hypothetical protein